MKKWTVYKHVSPSGKVYVGITCQKPEKRWKGGAGYVRKDHHQQIFANAILKYGWDNIEHIIVADGLTKEEACNIEKALISKYKREKRSYNVTDGGDGGLGTKHTKETRQLLSVLHTGKKEKRDNTIKRINKRIDLYPYIVVAVNSDEVLTFRTAKEAAEKLNIKSRCNISAAISGRQCLVHGYVFTHWDKNKPLDEKYLHELYNKKVNNKYITERKRA